MSNASCVTAVMAQLNRLAVWGFLSPDQSRRNRVLTAQKQKGTYRTVRL